MPSVLTPNEIDALMSAVQQGQLDGALPGPGEKGEATPYDLTSQDRVIRGQLPTLDSINDHVASQLTVGLGGRLRVPMGITSLPASLMKFADFHALMRPPATFVVLQLSANHGQAVATLPEELVRALLDAALGDRNAKIGEVAPETRRELTSVEKSVLARLLDVVCKALGLAWSAVLPLSPSVVRFETDPRLAALAPAGDVAILNTFQFTLGDDGARSNLQLAIPYAAVEAVKKKLQASPRNAATLDKSFSNILVERLQGVPVELCAVLGKTRMSLKDFLRINVGDVIPLNTAESRPLSLVVQGCPKLLGTPHVNWGRMALTIQDGLQPPANEPQPAPLRAG